MSQDRRFLQFVREQMEREARELDTATVLLRIEGTALVVFEQGAINGRLCSWDARYPVGIDVARLRRGECNDRKA